MTGSVLSTIKSMQPDSPLSGHPGRRYAVVVICHRAGVTAEPGCHRAWFGVEPNCHAEARTEPSCHRAGVRAEPGCHRAWVRATGPISAGRPAGTPKATGHQPFTLPRASMPNLAPLGGTSVRS